MQYSPASLFILNDHGEKPDGIRDRVYFTLAIGINGFDPHRIHTNPAFSQVQQDLGFRGKPGRIGRQIGN
jgi:hypothetical protein